MDRVKSVAPNKFESTYGNNRPSRMSYSLLIGILVEIIEVDRLRDVFVLRGFGMNRRLNIIQKSTRR